ncbi:AraC family transcriptional regulator [Paenibacillus alba]|uniref:AraC family transcriptional regulator n=1 Tax=Paenibacillus alba TaxID=1197127 RepID=A0ABU6GAY9_9BACL|nr:AraC family transcriptional regulator [Paenibacillus alba]MEC0231363.1 AraC family transcriptional regulator [Paenibacillus alba]
MKIDENKSFLENEELLSKLWFKLIGVERLTEPQLKYPHERDFIESDSLMFIVSDTSEGRLVVNGQYYPLRPGAVFLCRPGQLIEAGLHAGRELGLTIFRFQAYEMKSTSEHTAVAHAIHNFSAEGEAMMLSAAAVLPLCKMIAATWNNGSLADRFSSEAGFHELIGLVLKHQEQKTAMALEYAKGQLERDFAQEITIEQLTANIGLSRFHFMRLFKEKFGKGVIEYVTELRLSEAKKLMREMPDSTLRDIAFRVGYKNETYFSNLFKKHMGVAPAVYLKQAHLKIAAYSWVNIGQLLALQIIPYAAPLDHYWTDYYRSRYAFDVLVPLSHHYEFNRESLRKMQPDYIIGIDCWIEEDEQQRLAQIAPALFLPWDKSWREHHLLTAQFLGKTKEAEKWLDAYDQKAKRIHKSIKMTLKDQSVLVVVVHNERLLIWGRRAGTVLYDDLGIAPAEHIDQIGWTKSVEVRDLADFDADHMIMNISKDPISQSTWQLISKQEGWRDLKAVKKKQVHYTSGLTGLEAPWNEYNAFGHERFMQQMGQLFHN